MNYKKKRKLIEKKNIGGYFNSALNLLSNTPLGTAAMTGIGSQLQKKKPINTSMGQAGSIAGVGGAQYQNNNPMANAGAAAAPKTNFMSTPPAAAPLSTTIGNSTSFAPPQQPPAKGPGMKPGSAAASGIAAGGQIASGLLDGMDDGDAATYKGKEAIGDIGGEMAKYAAMGTGIAPGIGSAIGAGVGLLSGAVKAFKGKKSAKKEAAKQAVATKNEEGTQAKQDLAGRDTNLQFSTKNSPSIQGQGQPGAQGVPAAGMYQPLPQAYGRRKTGGTFGRVLIPRAGTDSELKK